MAKKSSTKAATKPASKGNARKAGTAKPTAAKKTAKKTAAKPAKRSTGRAKQSYRAGDAKGKDLVIVESPSKAKTINRYLGHDYVVLASIGHVRDLPSKNPKGVKSPVPGVNLQKRFTPTYEILSGKEQVISDLKRAAKDATTTGGSVWFATDLDREGEAIAWHLAEELGINSAQAKRVVFPAITKTEIDRAFNNPHPIDIDRVNAQQARRILDRIVGYQVSPLLWKKVARGLSAGRVQSVAVRLVVEREREIRAFVPDESWTITGYFALADQLDQAAAKALGQDWRTFITTKDEKNNTPTLKQQNARLSKAGAVRAELVAINGEKFNVAQPGGKPLELGPAQTVIEDKRDYKDLAPEIGRIAKAIGLTNVKAAATEDKDARGPARFKRTVSGVADPAVCYQVTSVETKRTKVRPTPPFITSTMQQAASSRLGFGAQRTMRVAQGLYEGVDIPGEGPVGLITYMRTDSTHLSNEAIEAARTYINNTFGDRYLPEKPNRYTSSNKSAQEAHEAIRPTSLSFPPSDPRVKRALNADQHKLYTLIWNRFVGCQMTPAEWDQTAVTIEGGTNGTTAAFRATGRTLAFDGHYKVTGVPQGDELNLPKLQETDTLRPFHFETQQKFSSPPSRYSEASLIKVLESEGIGRPSTYASIIQVIQDRRYVEIVSRAFHATDLGEVVTDKLIEAFPSLMDVGYTREMEHQLDQVEEEHLDWIDMLQKFYGPFTEKLKEAEETLGHAKAEVIPAPDEYRCEKCGAGLVYRFGRNGKFLSCSRYPDCNYASPVDRLGRPMKDQFVDVACPKTGRPMVKKTGRFGPFLTTPLEEGETNEDGIILNIDKSGKVAAPSQPPLETDLPCPTCGQPLNLRSGVRGPWLGCSAFPKCRGRGKWAELEDKKRDELEKALESHAKNHPIPTIEQFTTKHPLTDNNGKPRKDAPKVDELTLQEDPRAATTA